MASEWGMATIDEIADKVAMGPFGSSIKVETFVSAGIPVISGQHLHGFKLLDSEFNFITPEHAERLRNANVQRGDVIFTQCLRRPGGRRLLHLGRRCRFLGLCGNRRRNGRRCCLCRWEGGRAWCAASNHERQADQNHRQFPHSHHTLIAVGRA